MHSFFNIFLERGSDYKVEIGIDNGYCHKLTKNVIKK